MHLFGPIYINSYGTMIACAIGIFTWLVNKDPRRAKLISTEQLHWMIIVGIISGVLGGRILYFFIDGTSSIRDFFSFWHGGFAVLGSLIGVLCVAPWYLKRNGIPLLPFLDLTATYAPLLQGISRIGCFLAGCCYGKPTNVAWAVTYYDQASTAPLHIPLHPTQLYSSLLLLGIFFLLKFPFAQLCKKNGQLVSLYIFFMAAERYITDLFRGDQSFGIGFFGSSYQLLACLIMFGAALYFSFITTRPSSGDVRP